MPFLLLLTALPSFAQTVQIVRTTADLSSTLAPQASASFGRGTPTSPLVITVNEKSRLQVMDGFGASLTDGSAWLLQDRLTPAARQQVMTRLFDPSHGIGLSFLRQPIASTDLSRDHYSFDDMPEGEQDPEMKHFSAKHDDSYVFPITREALKLNPAITVMATPWSPPAWMKSESMSKPKSKSTMNGGALRDDAMPAYSAYLVRSVQAFQAAGVPVKYLTVQNEPLNETKDYPGTLMQANQQKRLIGDYLGPDLKRAGLNTQVLAYDHNWDHPEYPLEVLDDPAAAPFVAGSALHCYGGDVAAQTAIHDRHPEKGVWMTECSGGTWQKESPLLTTAHLLIESTRNWAKAVVLWGIALDTEHNPHAGGCGTCRGLVTVDLTRNPATVTYTGDFYALGQASQFVRPGATRIDSSSFGRQSLETVAFQNTDGSIALLVLNNKAEAANFDVSFHGRILHASLLPGALATYSWANSL
ncbi:MAG: O-glycosyl hydrolase [Acidobacteriaceae bacterium]|nr:O-glycosyl hydrolase [Acidobacteriaceae bacterium]